MLEINKTDSERRELLRPFEIPPTDGFVYDLRQICLRLAANPDFPKSLHLLNPCKKRPKLYYVSIAFHLL
ncbi:hypothetical protein EFR42_00925 [Lactobacillus delbrueckii]|nr:hypothetical protein [Lactobacillus delbrueckii]MCT3491237.1 hypothetical protein [Lactobacillus delbrueckii]